MTFEEFKKVAPELKREIQLCPEEIEVVYNNPKLRAKARSLRGEGPTPIGPSFARLCEITPYEVTDDWYDERKMQYVYILERA